MSNKYTHIPTRIGTQDEAGTCRVEAELSDGSAFGGGELRHDEESLLLAQLDPRACGLLLFQALFAGWLLPVGIGPPACGDCSWMS